MSFMQCLRAGLQHAGASQPQLGAGAAHGAGVAHGAGAAQQLGAGASQPQLGAASQQLFLLCRLLRMPLILHPRFNLGRHAGAESQQTGAGDSQQTGAGLQQSFFLQNRPAEALEDEIAAQTTTVKVTINRRMELSPKQKVLINRAVNFLAVMPIRDMIQCHHSLMAVDAKSVTISLHSEIGNANPAGRLCIKV